MYRTTGSTRSGGAFTDAAIAAVWSMGTPVAGWDPNHARKDRCGSWMVHNEYGQTTQHGWEIDHQYPVALGGGDELSNLQPLNWKNNRSKGDSYPNWSCARA